MNKSNLILASVLAIIFTSILIIFSPTSKKTSLSSPTPSPVSTESISPTPDPTADWKTITISPESTLNLASYQIDIPSDWKQLDGLSIQNMEIILDKSTIDTSTYKLAIDQDKNKNPDTGKAYANLKELTGFPPFDVPILEINGISMAQVAPNDISSPETYRVMFFSNNNKLTFKIDLETPQDGSKLEEGKILFGQILSTFKFIETTSPKTPAIIPPGWKSDYYGSDSNQRPFTLAYPSGWFFGVGGPIFSNYDSEGPNIGPSFRPEDVKCDVVDFRLDEVEITNPINISKESPSSYKIIRGDNGDFTVYQINSTGKMSLHVVCYAFTKSDAKIVDQIVKTIRY